MCRPECVHEYQLTPHSLYAAVSVGLETETIISVLNRLSKVQLSEEVKAFIRNSTQNYGKVGHWGGGRCCGRGRRDKAEQGSSWSDKVQLLDEVKAFICNSMQNYGKVRQEKGGEGAERAGAGV